MKTEAFIQGLILAGIQIIEIPIDGIAGRIGRRMEIHILDGRSKLSFSMAWPGVSLSISLEFDLSLVERENGIRRK